MEVAPTYAYLVPTARPAPVPLVSSWKEMAGRVMTPQTCTCFSPTGSACAGSPWTPMTSLTCTSPCLSCTMSSRWTTTASTENCITLMWLWMLSGIKHPRLFSHTWKQFIKINCKCQKLQLITTTITTWLCGLVQNNQTSSLNKVKPYCIWAFRRATSESLKPSLTIFMPLNKLSTGGRGKRKRKTHVTDGSWHASAAWTFLFVDSFNLAAGVVLHPFERNVTEKTW